MPDDVTAPPSIDARVRFRLALAKIERDVLVSGLTDEEIDSLVATLAPAAPVEDLDDMDQGEEPAERLGRF